MAKRVYFSGWVDISDTSATNHGVGLNLLDQLFDHSFDFVEAFDYDYQVDSVTDIEDEDDEWEESY